MRIISGSAKGREIFTPKGRKTRPTADKVKESIFNIIQNKTCNSKVLDLFAGSGNLGLESLSRGSESAIFIDKDKSAFEAIKKNISNLGFEECSEVYNTNYENALYHLYKRQLCFDIIFLDPPYKEDYIITALREIIEYRLISDEGIIIAEHDKKRILADKNGLYKIVDLRDYGITSVSFIAKDV